MYEIGVKSIPVIGITGAFIGMVMAVETYSQFKAIGQENRLGSVIILSVVKQIGPVLAAVMLAGPGRRGADGGTGNDERHRATGCPARHGGRSDPVSGRAAIPGLRAAHADADDLQRHHGHHRRMVHRRENPGRAD